MKKLLPIVLILLSVNVYGQYKSSKTQSRSYINIIDSTDIAIISMDKNNKIGGANTSSLFFIDTKTDSVTIFSQEGKIINGYAVNRSSAKYNGERFIIVEVQTKNLNDKLDWHSPMQLYICTLGGKSIKQISSDKIDVKNWVINENTNKLIFVGIEDTNGDNKYNEKDTEVVFSFNLSTGLGVKLLSTERNLF